MQQEHALRIAHIEALRDIRHEDHGELQPLALMDAHDAHDILTRAKRTCHGKVRVAFFEVFEKAQEAEQPAVIRLLIFGRAIGEHAQIGLTQKSALETADVIVISRLAVEFPDELRHAVAHSIRPPAVEHGAERCRTVGQIFIQRGLRRMAAQKRAEKVFIRHGHAQACELFHREAAERRNENRGQRNFLPRVVDDF